MENRIVTSRRKRWILTAMSDELVTLATFDSTANAHAARSRLAAEGIRAMVTDDVVVETLWHASPALGGIRLRVMSSDLPRAQAILNEFEHQDSDSSSPWRCGPCQQDVDAGFDVCWSCGRPREEVEDRTYVPKTAEQEPQLAVESGFKSSIARRLAPENLNPYRSSHEPAEDRRSTVPETSDVEETVRRALRAAILGMFICPVAVHFYSMYLLAVASLSGQKFSRAIVWRFWVALAINVVATVVFVYAFGWGWM